MTTKSTILLTYKVLADLGKQLFCKHPEDKIWYNEKSQMQRNECGKEL